MKAITIARAMSYAAAAVIPGAGGGMSTHMRGNLLMVFAAQP